MKKQSNPLPKGIIRPNPPLPPSAPKLEKEKKPKLEEEKKMIGCKVEKHITVTLTLEEEEALWLKGLVQNPIGCTPDQEPKDQAEMRRRFWEALKDIVYRDI